MKTYFIAPEIPVYKANLHCHSVFSDGKWTPEEIKDAYMEKGYSVVAFTDHEYILDHSALSSEDFIAITGCEMQIMDNSTPVKAHRKATHLNLYSKDPHNCLHIYFNKKYFSFAGKPFGNPDLIPTLKYIGPVNAERFHTTECLNAIIRQAKENGYLVAYNHPAWSLEDVRDYGPLQGLFAMEIFNNETASAGFSAYANKEYEEMLRAGQRISCLASDDNHNRVNADTARPSAFGGFTMLYPKEFTYAGIIDAMEHGKCYASTGPLIRELYYEDGRMHIETTPCCSIFLRTFGRRSEAYWESSNSELTAADFSVKDTDVFVRFEVRDRAGRMAFTRAYFLDEFPIESGKWYTL